MLLLLLVDDVEPDEDELDELEDEDELEPFPNRASRLLTPPTPLMLILTS